VRAARIVDQRRAAGRQALRGVLRPAAGPAGEGDASRSARRRRRWSAGPDGRLVDGPPAVGSVVRAAQQAAARHRTLCLRARFLPARLHRAVIVFPWRTGTLACPPSSFAESAMHILRSVGMAAALIAAT